MRNSLHCISAVAATLLYMLGVAGFDMHRCEDSHQTYFAFLASGITCSDIHPDCPCHHDDGGECDEDEDCCCDTIGILGVTGEAPTAVLSVPACPVDHTVIFGQAGTIGSALKRFSIENRYYPPPASLSLLCVFRV